MGIVNVVHNVVNVIHDSLKKIINCFKKAVNQFSNIMNGIDDIMNDTVSDNMGHNIVNDIEQLCISQAAFLLLSFKQYPEENSGVEGDQLVPGSDDAVHCNK